MLSDCKHAVSNTLGAQVIHAADYCCAVTPPGPAEQHTCTRHCASQWQQSQDVSCAALRVTGGGACRCPSLQHPALKDTCCIGCILVTKYLAPSVPAPSDASCTECTMTHTQLESQERTLWVDLQAVYTTQQAPPPHTVYLLDKTMVPVTGWNGFAL